MSSISISLFLTQIRPVKMSSCGRERHRIQRFPHCRAHHRFLHLHEIVMTFFCRNWWDLLMQMRVNFLMRRRVYFLRQMKTYLFMRMSAYCLIYMKFSRPLLSIFVSAWIGSVIIFLTQGTVAFLDLLCRKENHHNLMPAIYSQMI